MCLSSVCVLKMAEETKANETKSYELVASTDEARLLITIGDKEQKTEATEQEAVDSPRYGTIRSEGDPKRDELDFLKLLEPEDKVKFWEDVSKSRV